MFKFCHFQHIQNQKLFFIELVGFTSNAETPFKSRPIPVFVLYCPPPPSVQLINALFYGNGAISNAIHYYYYYIIITRRQVSIN